MQKLFRFLPSFLRAKKNEIFKRNIPTGTSNYGLYVLDSKFTVYFNYSSFRKNVYKALKYYSKIPSLVLNSTLTLFEQKLVTILMSDYSLNLSKSPDFDCFYLAKCQAKTFELLK